MQYLIVLLVAIITARLEPILSMALSAGNVMPDLMLLYVIYFALFCPTDDIPLYAWVMGLIRDFLFEARLGVFAIAYLVSALIVRYLRTILFRKSIPTQVILSFLIVLGIYMFISVFRAATLGGSLWLYWQKSLYIAIYSAILAPFFCYLANRVPLVIGYVPKDDMIS